MHVRVCVCVCGRVLCVGVCVSVRERACVLACTQTHLTVVDTVTGAFINKVIVQYSFSCEATVDPSYQDR